LHFNIERSVDAVAEKDDPGGESDPCFEIAFQTVSQMRLEIRSGKSEISVSKRKLRSSSHTVQFLGVDRAQIDC
jgi:hypothetical protein